MTNITLNLDQRVAWAHKNRELEKLQKKVEDQMQQEIGKDDQKKDKDNKEDLILTESLLILRDLVEMTTPEAPAPAQPEAPRAEPPVAPRKLVPAGT